MKFSASQTSGFALGAVLLSFFLWAFTTSAQGVTFTQSMDIGSQGSQVTALQTYLAGGAHYPEKLVTGYFGELTQAAVQRFQCAEEIVCSGTAATTGYGRVGPKTLLQLNLRAGGIVAGSADTSAPFIFGVSVATSSNSATVTFATNEAARAQLYYAGGALTLTEAIGLGFSPLVGGTVVMADSALKTSHSITIGGLASSTTYFFTVQAVDGSGNLSMTWPTWFRTNP